MDNDQYQHSHVRDEFIISHNEAEFSRLVRVQLVAGSYAIRRHINNIEAVCVTICYTAR